MSSTLDRLLPLTGPGVTLFVVAAFGSSAGAPAASADGSKVISFYADHGAGQHVSDVLWMVALGLLVLFVGSLRSTLRSESPTEGLATTGLAGAAALAAGGCVYFGMDYCLASLPGSVDPAAAQALNLLALRLLLPVAVGVLVMGLGTGLAIVRSGVLPAWTGWVAVVLAFTGMAGPFSLVLLGLWAGVVGVVAFRRSPPPAPVVIDAAAV